MIAAFHFYNGIFNMLAFFIKGFIIGLAIAAPIGPTGILCIQRSLQEGLKIGLMTGLGAALADGVYGIIVGFGFTAISFLLVKHQFEIRLIGGIFLLVIGGQLFFSAPIERITKDNEHSPWHALFTSFFLTVSNPATVLAFIAVFAGLGVGTTTSSNYWEASLIVLGITLGSGAWWLFLSASVALFLHHRLSPQLMRMINRISGAIIAGFGLIALSICLY